MPSEEVALLDEIRPPSNPRTGESTGLYSGGKMQLHPVQDSSELTSVNFTPVHQLEQQKPNVDVEPVDESKGTPPAPSADQETMPDTREKVDGAGAEAEPKLFVDVNVANFGLQRIVVYDGDTVESLVADFVKRCPIDDFMVEKLKLLLQQQMDGVLERIDEDEDVEASDDDPGSIDHSHATPVHNAGVIDGKITEDQHHAVTNYSPVYPTQEEEKKDSYVYGQAAYTHAAQSTSNTRRAVNEQKSHTLYAEVVDVSPKKNF